MGPDKTGLYVHVVRGACKCGVTHRAAVERIETARAKVTNVRSKPKSVFPTAGDAAKVFAKNGRTVESTYTYRDATGTPLFAVIRLQDPDGEKTFRQVSIQEDGWVIGAKGIELVPYRLPELLSAIAAGDTVYVVEGEKDVHAIEDAGFPATCNPMGAGKDVGQYAKHFEGAEIVRIIADRDEVGREHARAWAKALEPFAKRVEILEPVEGKDAHDALVTHGLPVAEAFAVVEEDEPSPSESEAEEPPKGELPRILVNGRQAREVVSDILFAIAEANRPARLFSRIGHVVRVVRNDLGVGEARNVESADQLNVVSAAADYIRLDARTRTEINANPSTVICAAAFARLSVEGHLPMLRAVTPTPIIHEDGSIFDHEGYDAATRVYFAPAHGFRLGHVPEKPSEDDAQRAVATLMKPFGEMPFATDADCANFIAVLVTVVTRTWFRTAPFIVFEAPVQGSGKTLAAMATRVIAEGTSGIGAAPEAGKQGDSEWRKRITSALLAAPSVVIFDNVTGTLGGPILAALSTSPTYSDRLLGTNEAPDLPNTATWIFTSNNAQVDADLLRRCVYVRLDPRDPTPHLRDGFEITDLIEHVGEQRGALLAAIYTIVRFWIVQGKPGAPEGTPTLGSFEKWSQVVPAILGAVGITGVLGDLAERSRIMRDPDEEDAAGFLEAWWERFPDLRDQATAREIVEASMANVGPGRDELPLPAAVLKSNPSERANATIARSLGHWLKFRRDRMCTASPGVVYAVRLAGGSAKRGFQWRVERILIGGES